MRRDESLKYQSSSRWILRYVFLDPTVAVVNIDSFTKAIDIIGNIDHLNEPCRQVVIKVGIYNPKSRNCTTPKIVDAITSSFDR